MKTDTAAKCKLECSESSRCKAYSWAIVGSPLNDDRMCYLRDNKRGEKPQVRLLRRIFGHSCLTLCVDRAWHRRVGSQVYVQQLLGKHLPS